MERVEVKGVEDLDKDQKYQLNKIVNSYFDKIKRSLKNDVVLLVKIKQYETAGKKDKAKKSSVQLQIKTSTKNLEASASDWDLNRTLHDVFKKMLVEIEHKFRVSEQK